MATKGSCERQRHNCNLGHLAQIKLLGFCWSNNVALVWDKAICCTNAPQFLTKPRVWIWFEWRMSGRPLQQTTLFDISWLRCEWKHCHGKASPSLFKLVFTHKFQHNVFDSKKECIFCFRLRLLITIVLSATCATTIQSIVQFDNCCVFSMLQFESSFFHRTATRKTFVWCHWKM